MKSRRQRFFSHLVSKLVDNSSSPSAAAVKPKPYYTIQSNDTIKINDTTVFNNNAGSHETITVAGVNYPKYQYSCFPNERSIRLLRLPDQPNQPYQLVTRSIDDPGPYFALSYTWGPPLNTTECITAYGDNAVFPLALQDRNYQRFLSVKRNLREFLDRLKAEYRGQYVWADALCINQGDSTEVSAQVQLMGLLYSRSTTVLIWMGADAVGVDDLHSLHYNTLGPALRRKLSEGQEMDAIESHCSTLVYMQRYLGVAVPDQEWQALVSFLDKRSWFSRAWVLQEAALAPHAEVLCAHRRFDWNSLVLVGLFVGNTVGNHLHHKFPRINSPLAPGTEISTTEVLRRVVAAGRMTGSFSTSLAGEVELSGAKTDIELQYVFLRYAFMLLRRYKATKQHDKIYGALGLFSKFSGRPLDELLRPDYSLSVQEVYTRAAWLLIRELPLLSPLSVVQDPSLSVLPGLPSWVPDFSSHESTTSIGILAQKIRPNASGMSPGLRAYRDLSAGGQLHLEGAHFATVAAVAVSADPSFKDYDISKFPEYQDDIYHKLRFLDTTLQMCHDATPPDGETAPDTLAKTLSVGGVPQHSLLPLSSAHFRSWLTYQTAIVMTSLSVAFSSELNAFKDLLRSLNRQDQANFPTPEAAYDATDAFAGHDFMGRWDELRDFNNEFDAVFNRANFKRRVFKTQRGYLALGPASTQPGDEVWVVRGAKTPFVLRREEGGTGRLRLVGECYVHGFMHGEMMQTEAGERVGRFTLV